MIRFWQDKRGSVAIIVAVSAMLLVVIAGAAVDFATANYVRGSLQSAVDSASLAAGRLNIDPKDSISVKEQQLTDEARNVFSANLDLSPGLVTVEQLQVSYTPPVGITPDTVTASVEASIPTNFLRIVGIPQFSLTVNSETQRPQPGPLDLALVLDTTASMAKTPAAGGSETKNHHA
jgi:Flp pilus assembly protein TadG